eukprot:9444423-Pyramimonas_sp.AAC.1
MGPRNAVPGGAARTWSQSLGPSVEFPMAPRKAALGVAGRVWSQALGPSLELPMGPRRPYGGNDASRDA